MRALLTGAHPRMLLDQGALGTEDDETGALAASASCGVIEGLRTMGFEPWIWMGRRSAWCTIGAATDVLGLLRWWAHNGVGLLKGRNLRAPRYRVLTLQGFVA
jgi:hypothetical protein